MAIECKSLMLGDWVTGKKWREKPFKITRINDSGKYYYGITAEGSQVGPFLIEEIEPIPLTAEILEENGFEKICLKSGRVVYSLADDYYDLEAEEITDSIWRIEYFNVEASFPSCRELVSFVHEIQHFLNSHIIEKEIEL